MRHCTLIIITRETIIPSAVASAIPDGERRDAVDARRPRAAPWAMAVPILCLALMLSSTLLG